ncbi:hypothetical protein [Streptomyces sp. Tu 6176]|uniref:hypothetical protein n=1 Tax=Streptomyces sp. Tu 6176 TaxID=1470557 RepID=UPI001319EE91|nr:hypothetical protein [Streptomyces sp. Tu 6176]
MRIVLSIRRGCSPAGILGSGAPDNIAGMNLKETLKNSSGTGFVAGSIGVLGLALVVLGAVRGVGRLWAHLDIQLRTVPGAAPALVLLVGALLIACSFSVASRRSSATAEKSGR